MKRSFKFYRQNEADVMKSLGLKPTKNSGSGWIEKEDGQNDFIICQLKSTDAQSIKINQKDLRILEMNANTEHKIPVFAIQFLNTNEVWVMSKPEDLISVSEYIQTGATKVSSPILLDECEEINPKKRKTISSSKKGRDDFNNEQERKYKKFRSATK
jgi:hypothetical protein